MSGLNEALETHIATVREALEVNLANWPAQEKPPLSVQGCQRVGCGVYRWAPWASQMNQRSER